MRCLALMQASRETLPWQCQLSVEVWQAPVSRDGNINILHSCSTLHPPTSPGMYVRMSDDAKTMWLTPLG